MGYGYRAFICIEVPEEVRVRIRSFAESLHWPWARIVPDSQLHITLFFFESAEEAQLKGIASAMSGTNFGAFNITLAGVDVFTPDRPHVLVARVTDDKGLASLYRSLEYGLHKFGVRTDERPFVPHVTMARFKRLGPGALAEVVSMHMRLSGEALGTFRCGEIKLKRSTLTPKGPIYEDLHTVPASHSI